MTKTDLTQDLACVLQGSRKEARQVLEIILDSMIRMIHSGERVELRGFGSFSCHTRAARKGRNPVTGAGVNVPAKTVVHFRASRALKMLVNGAAADQKGGQALKGV
jgi:nucleoid DNA-binding protein